MIHVTSVQVLCWLLAAYSIECFQTMGGFGSIRRHHVGSERQSKVISSKQRNPMNTPTIAFDATKEIMEAFNQAFIGGTIGVMSVAIIVELRKAVDKNFENCPYCLGNGAILCGTCCGSKMSMTSSGPCSCCAGRGLVVCLNCKGDGRITPLILQPRATRDPEFATDSISLDSP